MLIANMNRADTQKKYYVNMYIRNCVYCKCLQGIGNIEGLE